MNDYRQQLKDNGLYDPRFEHDACGVGFVCNIKGKASNQIIKQGLEVLRRLAHRGATGADPNTGDGAGILIQMPHEFLSGVCVQEQIKLPAKGEYAAGLVFLPADLKERACCEDIFARVIAKNGLKLLGWRVVPLDSSSIGKTARENQPAIEQVFIKKSASITDTLDFERKLYVIRKIIEHEILSRNISQKSPCYITNLSSRTLSYKGLLMPAQVEKFFPDLQDKRLQSALCMVHSRYSTNTFPTWDLAQPFRFLAHNGEINTLRGNINWMLARQGLLKSKAFGIDLKKILPIIVPGGSDSAALDNVFELLLLSGRPLAHVMMMLIPGAWEYDRSLAQEVRDFYRYHACLMEPWDGPAAVAFTDGLNIGAVLDRNGLRPARYIITKDDYVVMASEAGVLDIKPEDILQSGRLEPGKIFFIDTEAGCIIRDEELKKQMAQGKAYGSWLKEKMVYLDALPSAKGNASIEKDLIRQLQAFGYTREDFKTILKPMVETAQEPVGSMGNDAPHALLSGKPQLLYNYFKQLFAQVTNPAMDPIREEIVMSLASYVGPGKNILDESAMHCHKLVIKNPVLSDQELIKIREVRINSFKTKVIPMLFKAEEENDFINTLDRVCLEAEGAIKDGFTFIILSDRGVSREMAALPALLATAAVHHHLVRKSLRTQLGIIVESGEPKEVHHFALLYGFGADAVNPYLAYEAVRSLSREKETSLGEEESLYHYIKAVEKGLLKILSKMGIATLQSYRGAQIFEALGIHEEVINRMFTGTVSRIGGITLKIIARETMLRHQEAYNEDEAAKEILATGGVYQWKRDGEFHLWNPETIAALQDAVWNNDYEKFQEFSRLVNDQSANPTTLRSLFIFKPTKSIPIEEVEPVEQIVKHFASGAMSFGSLSKEAHETIAIAMNRLKCRSNTGEGGEDPERFLSLANGDSVRSAVKQIASGRFGVTTNYLVNADEIQIKIAQGAKPGEGGQLPGHKVSVTIAKTRYTTPGVTLISPPPHHDIYSIEDLAQLIFDLKNVNPEADINVKLVSEIGVGTVAAGVAKGHADKILISGGDGGTGASPLSSIKHAGLPWELGLAETHQTLVMNNLRSRVKLQADGQMRTARDIAIAILLGAEEVGFATALLIVLGCCMLRHCNLNNCSVGVATQDEILRKRFRGKPEYLVTYLTFVARHLREIMSSLGVSTIEEMVGRCDLLELNRQMLSWKSEDIDLSRILYRPKVDEGVGVHYNPTEKYFRPEEVLDSKLIALAKPALEQKLAARIELPINNTNRSAGAMLSGRVCRRYGEQALAEDTIYCKFRGTAGQSFGAWLAKGITFELEGMTNDYVGKGISGGKIIIYPDKNAGYKARENIIMGNTAFYGAINGQAYIAGIAGERFCIRNSGLVAVVEGVGDHACEYMTGGTVVVLGKTGRNFAAGMSGGIAYVYNPYADFKDKYNREMVVLEELSWEDRTILNNLIAEHYRYTQSEHAKGILANFNQEAEYFVKVMPLEYKRILAMQKENLALELAQDLEG